MQIISIECTLLKINCNNYSKSYKTTQNLNPKLFKDDPLVFDDTGVGDD
jgi:hypothetical protein